MSTIDLATRFKIGMYLLNREKRNVFPRSTDIIQVLNELPTDKRHVKVPQDCSALHMLTTEKTSFQKNYV